MPISGENFWADSGIGGGGGVNNPGVTQEPHPASLPASGRSMNDAIGVENVLNSDISLIRGGFCPQVLKKTPQLVKKLLQLEPYMELHLVQSGVILMTWTETTTK